MKLFFYCLATAFSTFLAYSQQPGDIYWANGCIYPGTATSYYLNNYVNTVQGSGNTVIFGGSFLYPSKCVAMWDIAANSWDDMRGGVWQSYHYYTTASYSAATNVSNLFVSGDSVYVFGLYKHVDGKRIQSPAIWNVKNRTWSFPLDTSLHINLEQVRSVVWYKGKLLISGYFYKDGRQLSSPLEWTGTDFIPFSADSNNRTSGFLAVFKDELYATGYFRGSGFGSLAKWNGTTWTPVIEKTTSSNPLGFGSTHIRGLYTTPTHLYAYGRFDSLKILGDALRKMPGIVRFDGNTWQPLADTITTPDSNTHFSINTISIEGDILIAGGEFEAINSIVCNRIAQLHLNTGRWSSLGSGFTNTDIYSTPQIASVYLKNDVIYVGGSFRNVGTVSAVNMASYNMKTNSWSSLTPPDYKGIYSGFSMLNLHDRLEIVGDFNNIHNTTINKIAYFNGLQWLPIGAGLIGTFEDNPRIAMPQTYGITLSNSPSVAATQGNDYIFGGSFTHYFGTQVNGIFRYRDGKIIPLDSGLAVSTINYNGANQTWEQAAPHQILPLGGDSLIVAGDFQKAGSANITANSFALWDGNNWSSIGDGVYAAVLASSAQHGVINHCLWNSDGSITVCGKFRRAGTTLLANGLATWDGKEWHALYDGDWKKQDASYAQLFRYKDALLLWGLNPDVSPSRNRYTIYKLRGSELMELPALTGESPNIYSVVLKGDSLIIGGDFHSIGGIQANGIAWLDLRNNSWHSFGSGVSYTVQGDSLIHYDDQLNFYDSAAVNSIVFVHDTMYVTGSFLYAGGKPSHNFAIWLPDNTNSVEQSSTTASSSVLNISPNPATTTANIFFALEQMQDIKLGLYDALGREILHIADGKFDVGEYHSTISTDGFAQGIYYCILNGTTTHLSVPITILK